MPDTITLPSGYTVQIRTAKGLKKRHRDQVMKAMKVRRRVDNQQGAEENEGAQISVGDTIVSLENACITVAVTSWDVRASDDDGEPIGDILPVPSVDPASLDELSAEDGAFLADKTEWVQDACWPDFDVNPSEESPTPPSGD